MHDHYALTRRLPPAVLVEALKEQDARIAELERTVARNKRLEQLETLERLIEQR
jgi:hypothetical protein